MHYDISDCPDAPDDAPTDGGFSPRLWDSLALYGVGMLVGAVGMWMVMR